ncbi:MAG: hypothetical protein AB8G05_22565 [Oligoflexales bacterium]
MNKNYLAIIVFSSFLLGGKTNVISNFNTDMSKCKIFADKLKRCEKFTCTYKTGNPLRKVAVVTRTVHGAKNRKCRVSEVIKNIKQEIVQKNLCKFEAGILDSASEAYSYNWMSKEYEIFFDNQVDQGNCKKVQ